MICLSNLFFIYEIKLLNDNNNNNNNNNCNGTVMGL